MNFFGHYRKKNKKLTGFTLIELMVSSAIFITVASLAMEALFAMQASYVKIDGLRAVMDGLNTSFDLVTRDVRYGTVFFCGNNVEDANRSFRQSCPYAGAPSDGGTVLMFKPPGASSYSERRGYFLYGKKVYEYSLDTFGATSTIPITGDDVFVDSLRFFVTGANTTAAAVAAGNTENPPGGPITDNLQPVITIVMAGRSSNKSKRGDNSYFQMETTVTPRRGDI